MVFLYVFVVVVLSVCAVSVWSKVVREPAAARPWRTTPVTPTQRASAEGVLAAQLAAGEITERQYVTAMERLAAKEARSG
ncbi:hypothetical protein ACQP2F_31035 [Actinoplanes sp. CA-030573]|uniref:hypothetical protein n=1 Tax=Actinoplanes sp. CA-030573 TaxID=3239898 RepID=UPI003D8B660B